VIGKLKLSLDHRFHSGKRTSEGDTSFDSGLTAAMWAKRGLCSNYAREGRNADTLTEYIHLYIYIDIDTLTEYIYIYLYMCMCIWDDVIRENAWQHIFSRA